MKAQELTRRRIDVTENSFAELALWRLPTPLPPCVHPYKYRLAFVWNNQCVVRYDNERGKGDHRHIGIIETPYVFTDVDRLVADFFDDIKRLLDENGDH